MLQKPEQIEAPVFDPNKSYTWEKDANFILKGQEFGFILNSLRKSLGTPEAQSVLSQAQSLHIIENLLSEGIQQGIVKELEQKEEQ